jgi:hypothetical protein
MDGPAEVDLADLDERTFRAEAHQSVDGTAWEEVLRQALADEFVGRRAGAHLPDQDREAFIEHARRQDPEPRQISNQHVWCDGSVGVVTSDVTIGSQPGATFANVKLYLRDGEVWRCRLWQVTKRELPAT